MGERMSEHTHACVSVCVHLHVIKFRHSFNNYVNILTINNIFPNIKEYVVLSIMYAACFSSHNTCPAAATHTLLYMQ